MLGSSSDDESNSVQTSAPSAPGTEPVPTAAPAQAATASPPIVGENLGDVSGVIARVKSSVVVNLDLEVDSIVALFASDGDGICSTS